MGSFGYVYDSLVHAREALRARRRLTARRADGVDRVVVVVVRRLLFRRPVERAGVRAKGGRRG